MRWRKSVLVVTVLALCAAAAPAQASCSPAPFVAGYREAQGRILTIGDFLGRELSRASGMTNGQIAGQFAFIARETRRGAADIGRLEPPAALAGLTRRLRAALAAAAEDMAAISRGARYGAVETVRQATVNLLSDSRRIRAARRSLSRATQCT